MTTEDLEKQCNEYRSLLKECLPYLKDVADTSETYIKHCKETDNTYSHKRLRAVNTLRCRIYDAGVKDESCQDSRLSG